MYGRRRNLAQRLLGAADLALDFATLGEYGLEVVPADGPCRERPGHETGWEALARPAAGGRPQPRPRARCCRAHSRDARLPVA
jgi:hypothetical protein